MKIKFLVLFFTLLSVFNYCFGQGVGSPYYNGWIKGFNDGWCYNNTTPLGGCYVPFKIPAPPAPIFNRNSGKLEDTYKDGYNKGYAKGITEREKNVTNDNSNINKKDVYKANPYVTPVDLNLLMKVNQQKQKQNQLIYEKAKELAEYAVMAKREIEKLPLKHINKDALTKKYNYLMSVAEKSDLSNTAIIASLGEKILDVYMIAYLLNEKPKVYFKDIEKLEYSELP